MCLQKSLVVLKVKKVDLEQGKNIFSSKHWLPASQVCNSHPGWNSTASRSGHQGPHGLHYVEFAGKCWFYQGELFEAFKVDHQLMCLSKLDVTGKCSKSSLALNSFLYHIRGWVARGDCMFLGWSDIYNLPGQTSCQVQLIIWSKLLLKLSKVSVWGVGLHIHSRVL